MRFRKLASLLLKMDDDESHRKSLKRQKKEYKDEKRRITEQLVSALQDPTVVVMADFLKIRGALKKWNRFYCVLKPGLLIIYKNKKADRGDWVGTVLLNLCELIERPSKKDGFCFKLYHPMDMSIWGNRGPLGQSLGSFTLNPLNTSFLICRAPSDQAGRCWMDALELSFKCTGLLKKTMHKLDESKLDAEAKFDESKREGDFDDEQEFTKVSDRDAEKHFEEMLDGEHDDHDEQDDGQKSESSFNLIEELENVWVQCQALAIVPPGEQTEEVGDENKSLIWTLLKQIRPGMDLSKVVLPTFILEPRSFLEKLSDYYYHSDLITEAVSEEDPFKRCIKITQFVLSGFYNKPKGIKKPYNPILGETFRCKWENPDGSTTFYIAEQVSHHPPVSSIFVTNRKAGFNVSGTILAKSKYYGNSLSAILVGTLRLTLLSRGESYVVNLPYANCKGIMIGNMTMELGGQVNIICEKTGYTSLLDFQLKPMFGGSINKVGGSIKYGGETLATIEGHWDNKISIVHKSGGKEELWSPTPEIIKRRLPMYKVDMQHQDKWESEKLWEQVTKAIEVDDQYAATEEKTKLEEDQRRRAKSGIPHETKYFKKVRGGDEYEYIYGDYRPWDPHNDVKQIEDKYIVKTIGKRPQKKKIVAVHHCPEDPDESGSDDEKGSGKGSRRVTVQNDDIDRQLKELREATEVAIRRTEGILERKITSAIVDLKSALLFFFVVTTVIQSIWLFLLNKK